MTTPQTFREALFAPALIFAAFSLAMPVAWGSLALPLLILAWLLSGRLRSSLDAVRASPPAMWALALFALLCLGAIVRRWPQQDAFNFASKYFKLCLLPIVVGGVRDSRLKKRALDAFLLGLGIEVLVSYLRFFGVIAPFPDPNQKYIGLINHISLGFMLAFGCYVLLWRALQFRSVRWASLAAVFCANLMLLNGGRSGYVAFACVLLLLFAQRRGARGLALGALACVALFALALQVSPTTRQRLTEVPRDLHAFARGDAETAVGIRLEHDRRALVIIARHWLLGNGTGGFESAYLHDFGPDSTMPTNNPENEYLLIVAQLGAVGGAVLLAWCVALWRAAAALSDEWRAAYQALLVAMAVGCLFNSQLLDALEGRFFVVMAGLLLAVPAVGPRAAAPHAARGD